MNTAVKRVEKSVGMSWGWWFRVVVWTLAAVAVVGFGVTSPVAAQHATPAAPVAKPGSVEPPASGQSSSPSTTPSPGSPSGAVDVSAARGTSGGPNPAFQVAAFRQANRVAVISIYGEIDSRNVMASSVERRIRAAERGGADAIVFDINTPGGSVNDVLKICTAIKSASIANTIAWVNRDAYSGGAIIAMACREIVVNDPSSFGDAMPIGVHPILGAQASNDPEILKKILPPLISEVLDSTRRHNEHFGRYQRDEYLAQAIIANDVELWLVRSKTSGVQVCIDRDEMAVLFPDASTEGPTRLASIPGASRPRAAATAQPASGLTPSGSRKLALAGAAAAANQALSSRRPTFSVADRGDWELIEKVTDGSGPAVLKADDMRYLGFANNPLEIIGGRERVVPLRTLDDIQSFMGAKTVERLDANWSEGLVSLLTNIFVRGVLLVIFLVALFLEMSHPGAAIPGTVAIVALVLLLGPAFLVGMASWWEIAAILAGLILLGMEIFVLPGFGIAGVSGLILLFVGLVASFTRTQGVFPASAGEQADLLRGATAVLLSMLTAGVCIYYAAKHFGSIPLFNRLVLRAPGGDEESDPGIIGAMGEEPGAAVKIGDVGQALTPLRPSGKVQVGDQIIDAAADLGFVGAGTAIKVTSVTPFRIGVEAVTAPKTPSAPPA